MWQTTMVEYVLKSQAEGKRLEITEPPPKFERKTFHPSQDPSVAEAAAPKTADSLALGAWHDAVLHGFETVERALVLNHEVPPHYPWPPPSPPSTSHRHHQPSSLPTGHDRSIAILSVMPSS